ncbi:hypothetical protein HR12_40670 [Microbacterium sp. SUBG005]|nr:hypothetical protein HR12_40670 [Microbacterium sp. SUBG005]
MPVALTTAQVVTPRMTPIAMIAVYVARGMVVRGLRASSPNSAVASKPRNPVAASRRAIGSEPEKTASGGEGAEVVPPLHEHGDVEDDEHQHLEHEGDAEHLRREVDARARHEENRRRSTPAPHRYQCRSKPVSPAMIDCMKKPLVPIVPTTKKL